MNENFNFFFALKYKNGSYIEYDKSIFNFKLNSITIKRNVPIQDQNSVELIQMNNETILIESCNKNKSFGNNTAFVDFLNLNYFITIGRFRILFESLERN